MQIIQDHALSHFVSPKDDRQSFKIFASFFIGHFSLESDFMDGRGPRGNPPGTRPETRRWETNVKEAGRARDNFCSLIFENIVSGCLNFRTGWQQLFLEPYILAYMVVSAKFVHERLCNHLSLRDSDLLAPLKLKKCQNLCINEIRYFYMHTSRWLLRLLS